MSVCYISGTLCIHGLELRTEDDLKQLHRAIVDAVFAACKPFRGRLELSSDVDFDIDEKAGAFNTTRKP